MVIGDIPLDMGSPSNLLSWAVGFWAHERGERLRAAGSEVGLDDFLTGQMSVRRDTFESVGGFDRAFTDEGAWGGSDIDFGYRVAQAGCRIVFNPDAISYQYYDIEPSEYLRRAYGWGMSDQELAIKHPEEGDRFADGPDFHTRFASWPLTPLVSAPAALSWPLRAGAAALVRTGHRGRRLRRLFFAVRTLEYKRGAREARRQRSRPKTVVLAYHAIGDLAHDPILAPYAVTPGRFAEQLDALRREGWKFVDLGTVLGAISGAEDAPGRALLVTFDDAYADLLTEGSALLGERGIPAVVFALSGHVGGTNSWAREGATSLPLLDADGLRAVAASGIEIGSHGVTHRSMPKLTSSDLASELRDSADALEALGLPRPRALAYPYGEWNGNVAAAAEAAGYEAAFTVEAGEVGPRSDRFALPRVEVLADDTPLRLRAKVATAAWPPRLRELALRLLGVRS
jgi:peptidoglycan/xylan/chitin deacetylase (PgdA/CDA1 family)